MLDNVFRFFRRHTENIILASASPRRQQLLRQAGLENFTVAPTSTDERVPETMTPDEIVKELSLRKAMAAGFSSRDIVIAADTLVWIDDKPLGKPATEAEAVKMLQQLSGRDHCVYTGVTVRRGDDVCTEAEMTRVFFRELDKREIKRYVKTGEPMDKAGAYGIQGAACTFVERIEGDYFNVVGLPMATLASMLKKFGVTLLK